MTDKEHADKIRSLAKELTMAMKIASGAGLTVEVSLKAFSWESTFYGHRTMEWSPVVLVTRVIPV